MITQVLAMYLVAWLWVWSIAVGALPWLMLHELTGGTWGERLRAPLHAATSTMPIVAIAFVPVLFAMAWLYPWTHATAGPTWYLNGGFFAARAVVYFAVWIGLARWCVRGRDVAPSEATRKSAVGLIVYVVTTSFAGIDWIMSLTPDWHSTVFGMLVVVGQALAALAFATVVVLRDPDGETPAATRNDLGNLLLTFTMLWAYLAFTQYLIIWIGNLPTDIDWYVVRGTSSWRWIALVLAVLHFAVPFTALLFRSVKRSPSRLRLVALSLLVMRGVDLWWTVVPAFRRDGLAIGPFDAPILAAVIGGWLLLIARDRRRTTRRPLHVRA